MQGLSIVSLILQSWIMPYIWILYNFDCFIKSTKQFQVK